MNIKRKTILITLMLTIVFSFFDCKVAEASGISDIEDFNNLTGDAQYLNENYRDNYSFDIEDVGLLDSGKSMINDIANILFSIIRTLAYVVVSIFYFAMDFDVGKLIAPQLNAIQEALSSSVFKPLFIIAFMGTAYLILKRMAKRDMVGVMVEFAKVIGIVVLSYFVVSDSATALSYCTNITKGISVSALTSINNDMGVTTGTDFAADAAGILWVGMIHQPWVSLEFGNSGGTISDETIHEFLTTEADSKEREALVKQYMEDNPDSSSFNKGKGGERISFSFVYFFPFIIKSAIYLLVALVQLVFQILAIFYLILAPIILILALIPGYEMNVISTWLKKILETQLSILVITFMMGLLIKLDTLLYALSGKFGWFVILIIQTAIGVGLFLGRDKILHVFSGMQKGLANPGYIKSKLMKSGNLYEGIENGRNRLNRHTQDRSNIQKQDSSNSMNAYQQNGNNRDGENIPISNNHLPDNISATNKTSSENKPRLQKDTQTEPSSGQRRIIRTDMGSPEGSPGPDEEIPIKSVKRPNLNDRAVDQKESEKVVYLREYQKPERVGTRSRKIQMEDVNDQNAKSSIRQNETSSKTVERPHSSVEVPKPQQSDPQSLMGQNEASSKTVERPHSSTDVSRPQQSAPQSSMGQNEASVKTVERPQSSTEESSKPQLSAPQSSMGQNEASVKTAERPQSSTEVSKPQLSAPQSSMGQNEVSVKTAERPQSSTEVSKPQLSPPKSSMGQNEASVKTIERPQSSTEVSKPQLSAPQSAMGQTEASVKTIERPHSSAEASRPQQSAPQSSREQTEASVKAVERPHSNVDVSKPQQSAPQSAMERNEATVKTVDRPNSSTEVLKPEQLQPSMSQNVNRERRRSSNKIETARAIKNRIPSEKTGTNE